MKITVEKREKVHLIRLENQAGLSLSLCSFGASIHEISLDGKKVNRVEEDFAAFLSSPAYYGKTVGPLAGRIQNACFEGRSLEANEGQTCLHGGPKGYSFTDFDYAIEEKEDRTNVIFRHSFQDNVGLGGSLSFQVIYVLFEKRSEFRIVFKGLSNQDTYLNPTNHSYFNLDDLTVEKHLLSVHSKKHIRYDKDLLPLEFVSNEGPHDFSKAKEIGKDIRDPLLYQTKENGYDAYYLFEKGVGPQVVLSYRGLSLEITTDMSGAQIYSSNYPEESRLLNDGEKDRLYAGLAIEPMDNPLDHEGLLLKANLPYSRYIGYHFKRTK